MHWKHIWLTHFQFKFSLFPILHHIFFKSYIYMNTVAHVLGKKNHYSSTYLLNIHLFVLSTKYSSFSINHKFKVKKLPNKHIWFALQIQILHRTQKPIFFIIITLKNVTFINCIGNTELEITNRNKTRRSANSAIELFNTVNANGNLFTILVR